MTGTDNVTDNLTDNLVWTEDHLGHNISPSERRPPRNVTTIISTRYWVDSVHETIPRPGRDYFAGRADLFTRFTIPSVAAQITRPDRWLVLFSPWVLDLPEVKPVADLVDRLPFAEIVTVPEDRAFSSVSRHHIANLMTTPTRHRNWLASVRLDNDDMLALDYVDALTKWVSLARPTSPSTVVFPIGVQIEDTASRLFVNPVNHFTAAISQPARSGVFDPYLVQHTEIYRTTNEQTATVYQLPTRFPMWAEILHETNAANHHRPGPRIDIDWDRFRIREETSR